METLGDQVQKALSDDPVQHFCVLASHPNPQPAQLGTAEEYLPLLSPLVSLELANKINASDFLERNPQQVPVQIEHFHIRGSQEGRGVDIPLNHIFIELAHDHFLVC